MEGTEPLEQAKKALRHLQRTLLDNPSLAYIIGPGSQSFALLTEAHASLNGWAIQETRKAWVNREARNPREGYDDLLEACQRIKREHEEEAYVISMGAVEDAIQAVDVAEGRTS